MTPAAGGLRPIPLLLFFTRPAVVDVSEQAFHKCQLADCDPLLFSTGSGCSQLQQPTDLLASDIHLLQNLHIFLLKAGVIGAHALFCFHAQRLDKTITKENNMQKNTKLIRLGQEHRIGPSKSSPRTNTSTSRIYRYNIYLQFGGDSGPPGESA
jgi:hypothetical protein